MLDLTSDIGTFQFYICAILHLSNITSGKSYICSIFHLCNLTSVQSYIWVISQIYEHSYIWSILHICVQPYIWYWDGAIASNAAASSFIGNSFCEVELAAKKYKTTRTEKQRGRRGLLPIYRNRQRQTDSDCLLNFVLRTLRQVWVIFCHSN